MLGGRRKRVGSDETHVVGHSVGADHVTLLARIKPVLPVLALLTILLANALCSLFDGTNSPSARDEVSATTIAYKYDPSAAKTSVLPAGGAENDVPYFKMTVSDGSRTAIDFNGWHLDGALMKDWVKGGDTFCFVYDGSNVREGIDDRDGTAPRYYVRIIQPTAKDWAATPNRWAWILHNVMGGVVWSNWFRLNPDGSAVVGCGAFDYEQATEKAKKDAEIPATWRIPDEQNPHTIAVETAEEGYLISFG